MAQLKYKTRGMTDPAKKEKVYFCCHPDEFSQFFEEISDDILKRQNCAVWYRDEKDPYNEEEHFHDLSRMQLFVMPVTTKLLNTKNRALDVDFRFAVDHHIPVLPLMQESGLIKQFSEKCGDLQYLDKFKRDDTAISYDEKLSRFLSDILVGDELAEKIRNAFDAYVFLSYRKKDRKYAQELMRLIHKNDFCRDIAIWYDEFLTPGENFNDSIREALEKSGLFVLAVTPNLVNETNYIMTTEYPMAKKENKPILPAELVPTDKDMLSEKYEDIPECTDARNPAALSDALLAAIKKMAIKESDDSPEHNFFIGLAYLSGIDVEVDHERALSLITSAAEAGVVEAQEKLASMYLSGDGVQRSFEKSIYWEQRLADSLYKIFESNSGLTNLENWLVTYIRIAGKYNSSNRSDEACDVTMKLVSLCDSIASETEHDVRMERIRLHYKAQAYLHFSTSYDETDGSNKGFEGLLKAYEILEALCDIDNEKNKDLNQREVFYDNWIKKDYALCLSLIGESYRKANNIEEAVRYYTKSIAIHKVLYEKYKEEAITPFVTYYAIGLTSIAGIHLLNYDCKKAAECYSEALAVLEAEEREHGNMDTVPIYVDTALSFANVYKISGEMQKHADLLHKIVEKIKEYKKKRGIVLYYSEFRAYVFLAQGYILQQKPRSAENYLERAQALNEEYMSICNRPIDELLTFTYYTLSSSIASMNGNTAKAKKEINKAVKHADRCIEMGQTVHAADCAGVYSECARLELDEGDEERCVFYMKKAIDTLEKYSFTSEDTRAQPIFVLAYLNHCAYSFDHGDMNSAIDYGLKCIENYEKFNKVSPALLAQLNVNWIYYVVAVAKHSLNKKDGRAYAAEKCDYFEKRVTQYGNLWDYDGLAMMYTALCQISGIFQSSKWEKKAFNTIEYMEEHFGDMFEKTSIYAVVESL